MRQDPFIKKNMPYLVGHIGISTSFQRIFDVTNKRDLLTEEDRKWLDGLGQNLSTWRELTCAQLQGVSSHELKGIAQAGVVYRDGAWVNAGDIVEAVANSLTWNTQIFEAWDYGFASGIHDICATLTSFDADILLIASGYKDQDLSKLSRASTDAVADAYRELYGVEESDDDCDYDDCPVDDFVLPELVIDDNNEVV